MEFEKWWNEKYLDRKGNDNSYVGYPEASTAWEAALEWALEVMDDDKKHGWPISASKHTIENELKAKENNNETRKI